MKLNVIGLGVEILRHYTDVASLEPVPKSFPNGTPDFSPQAYLSVPVPFEKQPISEEHRALLELLGWKEECDGDFWVLYG